MKNSARLQVDGVSPSAGNDSGRPIWLKNEPYACNSAGCLLGRWPDDQGSRITEGAERITDPERDTEPAIADRSIGFNQPMDASKKQGLACRRNAGQSVRLGGQCKPPGDQFP